MGDSMFIDPFVTACCGMESMSTAGPRDDMDRFGCALPRFSPQQSGSAPGGRLPAGRGVKKAGSPADENIEAAGWTHTGGGGEGIG